VDLDRDRGPGAGVAVCGGITVQPATHEPLAVGRDPQPTADAPCGPAPRSQPPQGALWRHIDMPGRMMVARSTQGSRGRSLDVLVGRRRRPARRLDPLRHASWQGVDYKMASHGGLASLTLHPPEVRLGIRARPSGPAKKRADSTPTNDLRPGSAAGRRDPR